MIIFLLLFIFALALSIENASQAAILFIFNNVIFISHLVMNV